MRAMTGLSAYVSGGYLLSRWTGGVDCTGTTLRRTTVANDHRQRAFFPDSWAIDWCGDDRESRVAAAAAFKIDEPGLADVIAQLTPDFDVVFGAWGTCFTLETARAYAGRHLSRSEGVELRGLGLHDSLVERFLDRTGPPPQLPGFAPVGASGTHEAVKRRQRLAPGAAPLGHELLVHEHCCFNSPESLHGSEAELLTRAGVQANEHGLIDDLADALRCREALAAAPLANAPGAEWLPWLIVRYPLPSAG